MKKIFIAICGILLAMASCKEHDTPITFVPATDSLYVLSSAAIPAADPHNVLVELFTGQSCSNCPAAHTVLDGIAASGQVNILGLYVYNFLQAVPPHDFSIYDFRDSAAWSIGNSIYGGISTEPTAGIDRIPVAGALLSGSGDWSTAINNQRSLTDSINLSVTSSYDGSEATIQATITYLKPMSTKQNLSIVIVEDSMISSQENGIALDTFYHFNDVMRDMITAAPMGDVILDTLSTKQAGTVYWRKYKYKLRTTSPAIIPAHCRVVAFVNSRGTGGDYHILQSAQTRFMP